MLQNNIYVINKPSGMTSFDVIRRLRKKIGIRRLGHAGTLDPFATGVLMVAAGRFTRMTDYFHRYPKTYRARFQLGIRTDTDDITGTVLTRHAADRMTREEVEPLLSRMTGTLEQYPPAISAKRVDGKRLHEVNRQGLTVKPRPAVVTIHEITVLSMNSPYLDLEITCGSGTYIRSIARDLGDQLGIGGVVSELERTRIGPYSMEGACDLETDPAPLPHRDILRDWDAYVLAEDQVRELLHGRSVRLKDVDHEDGDMVRIFKPFLTELIALARIERNHGEAPRICPEKVFVGG